MFGRISLRDRLRRQYTEFVTPRRGPALVVSAESTLEPFSALGEFVPLPFELVAVASRTFVYWTDGRPWVVKTYPRWRPDEAEISAEMPKWDAIARAKSLAEELRTGHVDIATAHGMNVGKLAADLRAAPPNL